MEALAAYQLTLGASLIAAFANAVFGTLLAWVLTRYEFPGRRLMDALVDFPFVLPTAVAGLTLANLFAPNGWLGQFLVPLGINGGCGEVRREPAMAWNIACMSAHTVHFSIPCSSSAPATWTPGR